MLIRNGEHVEVVLEGVYAGIDDSGITVRLGHDSDSTTIFIPSGYAKITVRRDIQPGDIWRDDVDIAQRTIDGGWMVLTMGHADQGTRREPHFLNYDRLQPVYCPRPTTETVDQ